MNGQTAQHLVQMTRAFKQEHVLAIQLVPVLVTERELVS